MNDAIRSLRVFDRYRIMIEGGGGAADDDWTGRERGPTLGLAETQGG